MSRSKIAGAMLLCSILSTGPASAAQTIDVGAIARPGADFSATGSAESASLLFQHVTSNPQEWKVSHDDIVPTSPQSAALAAPAEEMSGSAWLVGAGFGTIFLIAARRRRPDIQGV